ncbi:hypothetical protein HID58_074239 [Brassica napus]|uniref:NTF2 domain-containing protein n=1 Tax=Brassica napus TaxID=3708 RepID=A0ABQ7YGD4_BRANA|nr:hypothetical protein HID58_074239 [Brassica napus]
MTFALRQLVQLKPETSWLHTLKFLVAVQFEALDGQDSYIKHSCFCVMHMFHLMPTPQGSFYVFNDIFRLNYA